jgi:hypothetical protein
MTTYYVDGAVGNDANAGTAEGAGNAVATITQGLALATTGNDIVYVKASATYAENVTCPGITPAANTSLLVAGYETTPGDHGLVTIAPTSGSYCLNTSGFYYYWCNFVFDGGQGITNHCVNSGGNYHCFFNCVAKNGPANGFQLANWSPLLKCVAYGNTSEGISVGGYAPIQGCITYNNSTLGIDSGSNVHSPVYRCLSYNNTRTQIECSMAYANTTYRTAGSIYNSLYVLHGGAPYAKAFDNIAVGGSYPIGLNTTSGAAMHAHNLTYNGNLGDTIETTLVDPGRGYISDALDIIGQDPVFTDVDTQDFTISSSGAAANAGLMPGLLTAE